MKKIKLIKIFAIIVIVFSCIFFSQNKATAATFYVEGYCEDGFDGNCYDFKIVANLVLPEGVEPTDIKLGMELDSEVTVWSSPEFAPESWEMIHAPKRDSSISAGLVSFDSLIDISSQHNQYPDGEPFEPITSRNSRITIPNSATYLYNYQPLIYTVFVENYKALSPANSNIWPIAFPFTLYEENAPPAVLVN